MKLSKRYMKQLIEILKTGGNCPAINSCGRCVLGTNQPECNLGGMTASYKAAKRIMKEVISGTK